MGWAVKLAIVVLVLLVLLGAADVGTRLYAQRQVAHQIDTRVAGASSSVHISSFPFLGNLALSGKIDKVSAKVKHVTEEGFSFDEVDMTLTGVKLDRHQLVTGQPVRETHTYAVGRRCRWLLPGDLLHFMVNPDRRRMDPPFFQFREPTTVLDGFYAHDKRATLGVLLSTAHYLFDADVWSMFGRGRRAAARPVTPQLAHAEAA